MTTTRADPAPLPPYFLPRPPLAPDAEAAAAFDALFDAACRDGGEIDYTLPWPRWQFICHIADTRAVILHGSQNRQIELFEPRKSSDAHPFGDRKAVFGASDGIWPIYYAILDRAAHPMSLCNAAFRLGLADGGLGTPHYFFSISRKALAARPYAPGAVYFLPRETFEPMPAVTSDGRVIHVAQWASLEPTAPLTRVTVGPEDFPFLAEIRGHDDDTLWARAKADPDGFPWLDADAAG